MRTLELNKTPLWLVNPTDKEPVLDDDGFETGEFTIGYSTPIKIGLSLYPANGKVKDEIFGKDAKCDKIAVSTNVILDKNSLLFEQEPLGNFDTTFTYRVTMINESLNGYSYGLELRVGGK